MSSKFEYLLPPQWNKQIELWLQEDIPSLDYGGFVVGIKEETSVLYCKSYVIVLAGVPFFNEVFRLTNCSVEWLFEEGTVINPEEQGVKKVPVAYVRGKCKDILIGERLALNIFGRCSSIATQSKRFSNLKEKEGFNGVIAGSRKTTPGFRLVEKYGMLVGGCDMHRMDLSSMIMLKDNHIWSRGNITEAVKAARSVGGFSMKIDVEVGSFEEACEAIEAGGDIIMLDNIEPPTLHEVAKNLKEKYSNKTFLLEASGGVTLDSIVNYFGPNIDIISMSGLNYGVTPVDFSLKIQKQ
ncbi:nicotinate-nucleotide diphosphorylase [Conidiobolus coronatus NRRL 28638]|uniref:Nicotinate-nucleotide pyrophosphorylase [carboxylating] n=1 Tax=Conidiobolus coronatus (strain ATCC 28846 / CBS 209.66 / NRRL 28638) TaxID=796925 RepID=A0A137P6M7_CONC2|nr:nicotinate-nucleotide diphosphorylase [Conidiobolus coronatus NRRL 28638]|eukprot:KXN70619.1 nicotinate-nucleotide diphosphorylase [Conidiobolus coronatus NRRL 28638]